MDPEKLGPYKIGRVLGRGGMGAVYEGMSETDGSVVAIKVLAESLDEDAEDRLRFETEIETLKRLHHPNIVRLTGFGEEQGCLYYVMELVDGASLRQELRRRRVFQWYEAAKIGLEICQALRHAHDRGVIHRDIKPANILLDRDGNVKLSDFGIARFFGSQHLTDVHSIVGTLEYMSPEQAHAESISMVSDLYSLGCVLYVLLTGKPPFSARTLPELLRKHQETEPVLIRMVRHDVPDELTHIIADLLHLRPDDRPRNALLVIKRLQSLLQPLADDTADIKVLPMSLPLDTGEPDGTPPPVLSIPLLHLPPPQSDVHSPVDANAGSDVHPDVHAHRVRDPERVDLLADTVTSTSVMQQEQLSPTQDASSSEETVRSSDVSDSLTKSTTRFTAVAGSRADPFEEEERPRPVFSLPTLLASITLMVVGLIVYYLLQPVPPEVLFTRITAKVRECETEGSSLTQLRSAQNDIRQFLSMYPNHPSADQVWVFQDELDLQDHERRLERRMHSPSSRSLSPVERTYIEILTTTQHNPQETIDKLRAFIGVFQTQSSSTESASPYRFTSSPVEICVELARRRLKALEREVEEMHEEQKYVLQRRLDEAAEWALTDPKRAEEICRGIIVLYQHHRWADELVEEARRLLGE